MNPEVTETKRFFTVRELAQIAGVHSNTVRKWLSADGLAHYKYRRAIRIPRGAWEDFLRRHEHGRDAD